MPWKDQDYPPSMKNLDPRVRRKAIEVANALLEDGYEDGRAIAIATAQAKEWNSTHPDYNLETSKKGRKSGRSSHTIDSNVHVVPHNDGWAVKAEGNEEPIYKADTKEEAVNKGKELASNSNRSAIIHRRDGTIETSHNYT